MKSKLFFNLYFNKNVCFYLLIRKSSSFGFPMSASAVEAIEKFANFKYSYIILKVNEKLEEVSLFQKFTAEQVTSLSVVYNHQNSDHMEQRLISANANDDVGFHLLHLTFIDPKNGEQTRKTLFLFLLNIDNTPLKSRIAHSASLNSFIENIARHNVSIDKRFELDDVNDFTFGYVFGKLFPELDSNKTSGETCEHEEKLKFNKPRGPPGRGPRRMIK